jgi:hypothetical protein
MESAAWDTSGRSLTRQGPRRRVWNATRLSMLVNGETRLIRAGEYTLPNRVDSVVEAVFGLHGLPAIRKPRGPDERSDPAAAVTPAVLNQVYNISGVMVKAGSKNKQAVAEFQACGMAAKDLTQFFAMYVANYEKGVDDKVSKFVGDKATGPTCGEAMLDTEYLMGISVGVPTEFWLKNPFDLCGDVMKWAAALLADDAVPSVHSVSYGVQGNLDVVQCSLAKVQVIERSFMKLAARGVTILVSGSGSQKV